MPNAKNPKGNHDLETGNDFIEFAKKRGAVIEGGKTFTKVKTTQGATFINPSDHRLDKHTKGNLKRWFRLLGIMLFILLCVYPILIRMV